MAFSLTSAGSTAAGVRSLQAKAWISTRRLAKAPTGCRLCSHLLGRTRGKQTNERMTRILSATPSCRKQTFTKQGRWNGMGWDVECLCSVSWVLTSKHSSVHVGSLPAGESYGFVSQLTPERTASSSFPSVSIPARLTHQPPSVFTWDLTERQRKY